MAVHHLADGGPSTTPTWHTDGTPGITTATLLLFAVPGKVTGIRYYAGDTTEVVVGLWQGSTVDPVAVGTQLASATHTPPGVGWQIAPIPEVDVQPGVPYIASRWHPTSYAFVAGFFTTSHGQRDDTDPVYGPATTENIGGLLNTAYQAGWGAEAINGRYSIASAPGWPGTPGNGAYYGVDAQLETEAPTVTGTLTGTLPMLAGQVAGNTRTMGTLTGTLPMLAGELLGPIGVEPGVLTPGEVPPAVLTASATEATLIPSGRP